MLECSTPRSKKSAKYCLGYYGADQEEVARLRSPEDALETNGAHT